MNHKKAYEDKRVRKPVSFNTEKDADRLKFAESLNDFSNWVKKKIDEEIALK